MYLKEWILVGPYLFWSPLSRRVVLSFQFQRNPQDWTDYSALFRPSTIPLKIYGRNCPDKHFPLYIVISINALFISVIANHIVMTSIQETRVVRTLVTRLLPGEDVLETLEEIVESHEIRGGQISLIGAISQARLGYFELESKTYKQITIDEDVEVTSCIGNIARLEDGTPVVHAHMVVADESGKSHSGHLMKGCIVSVTIEIVINVFEDGLVRSKDKLTGLNLLNLH